MSTEEFDPVDEYDRLWHTMGGQPYKREIIRALTAEVERRAYGRVLKSCEAELTRVYFHSGSITDYEQRAVIRCLERIHALASGKEKGNG